VKTSLVERTLTELDHVRILTLLRRDADGNGFPSLRRAVEEMLDTSAFVPSKQVQPDVVTMNSEILLRDVQTSRLNTLKLCYPPDADPAMGFVSVLSPVGISLLGLRVGNIARWATPGGDERAAEILAVPFQPESRGDYTT